MQFRKKGQGGGEKRAGKHLWPVTHEKCPPDLTTGWGKKEKKGVKKSLGESTASLMYEKKIAEVKTLRGVGPLWLGGGG